MHHVSSSAILCIAAITAAASIGGFTLMATKATNTSGNQAITKSDYVANNAIDSIFTDYDGKTVSGTEVLSLLKNSMYDDIGIAVYNGSTWTNFKQLFASMPTSENGFTNNQEKLKNPSETADDFVYQKAKDKQNTRYYINPNMTYTGSVIRDPDTNAITGLSFVINFDSQSTGSYGGYDDNGHYHNGTQANPYKKPQNASSKTYTVAFYTNSDEMSDIFLTVSGDTSVNAETVSKNGYKFLGWYTDRFCTNKATFPIKITKPTSFYAKWKEVDTRYLVFDENGGTFKNDADKKQPYYYGEGEMSITAPEVERDGYEFAGWALTKGGTKEYDKNLNLNDSFFGSEKQKTVYAVWKAKTYDNTIRQKIYFDQKMTSAAPFYGSTATKKVAFGQKFKISTSDFSGFTTPNGFVKKDTVFADVDSKWHSLTDEYVQKSFPTTFDIAYYPATYKISYNLNGGVNNKNNPTSYDVMHEVRLQDPTKTGYKFNGWVDANGNNVSGINVGSSSSFSSSSDFFAETNKRTTGNQTFTATWAAANGTKYSVTYRQQQNDGSFKTIETKTYTGTTNATIDAPRLTYSGFKTPDAKSITIKADGSASVSYDYYKQFSITYNMDWGTFATSVKKTYYSTDDDYIIPRPERNAWNFDGWTGSNGNDPQHDITIKKGSLGNKVFTANWVGETIAVTCEDWSVDYNGNLYKRLGICSKIINTTSGAKINGADWGTTTGGNVYHMGYSYHDANTITVSEQHHVVYRYFWVSNSDSVRICSQSRDGNTWIQAYGDITTTWKDKNGKIIKKDTWLYPDAEKGLTSFASFTVSPTWKYSTWPEGGNTTATNIRSVDNYTLYKNNGHRIYWNKTSATQSVSANTIVTSWNASQHNFVQSTWLNQANNRVKQAYAITKYWMIEQPDGTTIRKDWDVNGRYPTGTKISMHFDGDLKNEANPGWIIYDNDYPWYCGSSGDQPLNFQLKGGKSFILDGTVHIDGCRTYQDAYGIRFNVNGGTGNMPNQCISNIGTDAERKLTKNTFTHQGYHFAGWAKTPNATKPDFTDEAVMPIDFGSGSTSTANRKNTCKLIDLYAVWVQN